MKVVYSSTLEQEQEIAKLVSYFFETVLPKYFLEEDILHFREMEVLNATPYSRTLKGAYQLMTCLQVMITIIEKNEKCVSSMSDAKNEALLMKNIDQLNHIGVFFPFMSKHFLRQLDDPYETITMTYAEPANYYLI